MHRSILQCLAGSMLLLAADCAHEPPHTEPLLRVAPKASSPDQQPRARFSAFLAQPVAVEVTGSVDVTLGSQALVTRTAALRSRALAHVRETLRTEHVTVMNEAPVRLQFHLAETVSGNPLSHCIAVTAEVLRTTQQFVPSARVTGSACAEGATSGPPRDPVEAVGALFAASAEAPELSERDEALVADAVRRTLDAVDGWLRP